ncbi:hypothetical protein A2U01_0069468, partial [Trifolium medium]|nr:hypothetical protein [Trifolium medium]
MLDLVWGRLTIVVEMMDKREMRKLEKMKGCKMLWRKLTALTEVRYRLNHNK